MCFDRVAFLAFLRIRVSYYFRPTMRLKRFLCPGRSYFVRLSSPELRVGQLGARKARPFPARSLVPFPIGRDAGINDLTTQ
ncbi:MAG: hypothetical protein C4293_06130 [Nitrospiraceae bacterium]